jgi:hypothetical protein
MRVHAVARSVAQVEAFTAHCLPLQDDLADGLTPAEKHSIAGIRSLLINCLTDQCNAAAKYFLDAAPTAIAARRRAHALLRLSGERDQ